jgi:hypothetical protein
MPQTLDLDRVLKECTDKTSPTNRFFMAGDTLIEEYQQESLGYGFHQRVVLVHATADSIRAYFGVTAPTPAPALPVLAQEIDKKLDGTK